MIELVFVSWYIRTAVYRAGELIYFSEHPTSGGLLQALGFELRRLDDIPTQNIPQEFDRSTNGWWKPPQKLVTLEAQLAAWKARERLERIDSLRRELAELKGGDS